MAFISAQQVLESPITALVATIVICAVALMRTQPAPLWIGSGLIVGGLLIILAWWARPGIVPIFLVL